MKVAQELRDFLERNHLAVDLVDGRPAVLNEDGTVICTGTTVHTALRKAVLLSTCLCHFGQTPGIWDEEAI